MHWHRLLLHHALGAVGFAAGAALLAKRKALTAALCLASTHLHYACDMIGSAGPDGSLWSVPYFAPFDTTTRLVAPWQWGLASWQNVTITLVALLACAHLGATRGRTFLEAVSLRADAAVVEVLRRRWPFGRGAPPAG